MPIVTNHVAVTDAPVAIFNAATGRSAQKSVRVRIKNAGSNPVSIGASGVTTANGFDLAQNEVIEVVVERGESIHGVTALLQNSTVHYAVVEDRF